jgi:CelD/BcsL family acetyltransferase involved in cellulose biosynthesis
MRPSALGAGERAQWREMQSLSASLQRAFLSPAFTEACERAGRRAYVAVLHRAGSVVGFFPFEFRSIWHQRLRFAERIGGEMCDAAGIIAEPALHIGAASLLRLAGLSSLAMSHLVPGQEEFGLDAAWLQVGYVTDLRQGAAPYFTALLERDRGLVRDTERQMRRAEGLHGTLCFTSTESIPYSMIADLIEQKRGQYRRTQVADVFARRGNLRLIEVLNDTAAPDCRLIMHRLQVGSCVLAQHLGVRYRDVLSYWFPVYDRAAENLSPGRLLLWQVLQQAARSGISLIDYGEGDALYKRKFATDSTRYGKAYWSCGGARAIVARLYRSAEWRLRMRAHRPAAQTATPTE